MLETQAAQQGNIKRSLSEIIGRNDEICQPAQTTQLLISCLREVFK